MIESEIIARLKALHPGVGVYYGAAPQEPDDMPPTLPVIVVQRPASVWLKCTRGTDPEISIATVQIDVYAASMAEARRRADIARRDFASWQVPPGLDGESSFYDPVSRAWRVLQTWLATDYQPHLEGV